MRTTAAFSLVAIILAAALSGCGGSPMAAQSRYENRKPGELSVDERIRINRQYTRSRASGK